MFSGTCTIFNFYQNSDEEILWFPHVLSDVHVETSKGAIAVTNGTNGSDKVQLHILYDGDCIITDASGKALSYLKPKEWAAQEEGSLSETITFNPDYDFIMIGKWDGESPVNDSDYTDRRSEGFFAYMNRTYDDVYKMSSAQKYNVIPHFEVAGA